jgi:hypothetical protein
MSQPLRRPSSVDEPSVGFRALTRRTVHMDVRPNLAGGERLHAIPSQPATEWEDFMKRLHTSTRRWTLAVSAPTALALAGRLLIPVALSAGLWLATPVRAEPFSFSTGDPDGRLAALSQPASAGHLETETADDFVLAATTTIDQATIVGLIPSGTPLAAVTNVEIEIYHVFPEDSVEPPSGNVPARANSPGDVEIDTATRDARAGTLHFAATLSQPSFSVLNTVVDGINRMPANMTNGEGPASGDVVQIAITFTPPIVLPADHYFFRPQVEVPGGDFLYLSAPKPIVAPGTPFMGDLQAWIRNSDLAPDWLRIGTDIIGGATPTTFNMVFSLSGDAASETDTPTPTATPQPTATATDRPINDAGSGCSIGAARQHGTLSLLVIPAALLWWRRRSTR